MKNTGACDACKWLLEAESKLPADSVGRTQPTDLVGRGLTLSCSVGPPGPVRGAGGSCRRSWSIDVPTHAGPKRAAGGDPEGRALR